MTGRLKMGSRNLLLLVIVLAVGPAVPAQSHSDSLGRTPSPEEVRAWDITISNEGKGLPAGRGTADEGEKIYGVKCAACHGASGRGGLAPPVVIDKDPHTTALRPRRVMVTRAPFSSVLWDYINRAMPMLTGPGTLKPDEVYSLTAFLLYKNDVINENDVIDAQTLPKVKMPNRGGYVPPVINGWKPLMPYTVAPKSTAEKK